MLARRPGTCCGNTANATDGEEKQKGKGGGGVYRVGSMSLIGHYYRCHITLRPLQHAAKPRESCSFETPENLIPVLEHCHIVVSSPVVCAEYTDNPLPFPLFPPVASGHFVRAPLCISAAFLIFPLRAAPTLLLLA